MSTPSVAQGARGGGVVLLGQCAKIGIQVIGTMLLSRMLDPDAFGLIAMVAVFLVLGDLLRDFGMSTAALQASTLSNQQSSNVFWMNALFGAAASGILAVSTPLLVGMYDRVELYSIAPALAFTILLNSLSAQPQVLLSRGLHFRWMALTEVTSQIVGVGTAVLLALAGAGVWALVWQLIATSLSLLIVRMVAARWVPGLPRRGHDSRTLISHGLNFGAAQFLRFAANNVDSLAIGSVWGAASLGFYNRAFQIYQMPRVALLDPLTNVAVPMLRTALLRSSVEAKSLLARLQFLIAFGLGMIYLAVVVTADPIVRVFLGGGWDESVVLLQWLAVAGLFAPFAQTAFWSFLLSGQSRQFLYMQLVTKPLSVALVIVAAPFGVEWIAVAFAAGFALGWPIQLIWQFRVTGLASRELVTDGLRVIFAATGGFYAASWLVQTSQASNVFLELLLGVLYSSVTFIALIFLIPGGKRKLAGVWHFGTILLKKRKESR